MRNLRYSDVTVFVADLRSSFASLNILSLLFMLAVISCGEILL